MTPAETKKAQAETDAKKTESPGEEINTEALHCGADIHHAEILLQEVTALVWLKCHCAMQKAWARPKPIP